MWLNAGQYLRALPLNERAVQIARERDTERGAAAALLNAYATALCAVGRCAEAVPLVDEAVTKARAQGSPRRLMNYLSRRSQIHLEAGDLEGAAAALQELEHMAGADTQTTGGSRASMSGPARARLELARGAPAAAVATARRLIADSAGRPPLRRIGAHLLLAEACNAHGDYRTPGARGAHQ